MEHITLTHYEWDFDPNTPLGEGGLGGVYVGRGANGEEVAVKRILTGRAQYAHREMDMAEAFIDRPVDYLLPVLDAGQDAASGNYFLVMPKAETSLEDTITQSGLIDPDYAIEVLLDVTNGLLELEQARIVHRDLKPGNILYHEERWKIADFGIARFLERATAPNTLNDWLSPEYAAPEQWRHETPTSKADVYALGGIAHTMIRGESPFFSDQATSDLYRNAHLTTPPPELTGAPPELQSLVTRMLTKLPERRPHLQRIKEMLERLYAGSGNTTPLSFQMASASVAATLTREETERQTQETQRERRRALAVDARTELYRVLHDLAQVASASSPVVQIQHAPFFAITLGTGRLEVRLSDAYLLEEGIFTNSGWDVITDAYIKVIQTSPRPYEWSANLVFARRTPDEDYRWWEVSFFDFPGIRKPSPYEPYYVRDLKDMDLALSPVMHTVQVASTPRAIDDEDSETFYHRWLDRLAVAASGNLSIPRRLPLD